MFMKEIAYRLTCFVSGIVIGLAIGVFAFPKVQEQGEVVHTNAIVHVESETNRTSSSGHQVDWFKDSSNYIWDGWKIK